MARRNKICIVCGQAFTPDSPHQNTCSLACRLKRSNEQKRAWDRNNPRLGRPKGSMPDRACTQCGVMFQPSRRDQKYCCGNCCRLGNCQVQIPTQAEIVYSRENHADSVKMYTRWLDGRIDRRWTRSRYADQLEAAGLPGNFFVAASLYGISEGTLRMRLRRGTSLLMPLKRNERYGRYEDTPLSVFSEELKTKARVRPARAFRSPTSETEEETEEEETGA